MLLWVLLGRCFLLSLMVRWSLELRVYEAAGKVSGSYVGTGVGDVVGVVVDIGFGEQFVL